MNICLLTPTFLPKLGGVEVIVSSLARQFVQSGHRVVVVTQWPRKGRGTPQDHTLPYPVVRYRRPISFFWSIGFRGIHKALDQAYKILPFDVIHCHLAYPTGPVSLDYGRLHHIPVVITTHGSDIRLDSRYRQRESIWRRICRALQNADAVTAISQEMKSLLDPIVSEVGKPIPIIPNAVDMTELSCPVSFDPSWPVKDKESFILYLGGLTHKKGVDVLLQALSHLSKQNAFAGTLVVAGDGADRACSR
jgi:glycosyltransferase involved in cell wall biosynthesis